MIIITLYRKGVYRKGVYRKGVYRKGVYSVIGDSYDCNNKNIIYKQI